MSTPPPPQPPSETPRPSKSADGVEHSLLPTLDVLMTRIVDSRADEHDWSTFETLAQSDPTVWKSLACLQRDAMLVSEALRPALDSADRTRLPRAVSGGSTSVRIDDAYGPFGNAGLRRFGGWAVAAGVAIAWLVSAVAPSPLASSSPTGTNTAGLVPAGWKIDTPEDAVRAYLDVGAKSGRVLGEVPDRVVVRTTPSFNGDRAEQIEVIYLRQFVERAVVTDLYEMGSDEFGRPVPMRVNIPAQPPAGQWQ